ncbi:SAM-dependent methyltransferase [Mucilaginibacter sp. HMF5004]|uniref:HsdM family class I SAM-dependent methyltransferase n=1 Tax=Mucilaginibacter rivuli TaxID=2857527 RepID=UPI001C5E7558|nr:N-6 DNA methylase [Mucilaginibacter rivuli]MBW4890637.1 SAM-dependent methyltransferase [Mucilaginibacter rivuli]
MKNTLKSLNNLLHEHLQRLNADGIGDRSKTEIFLLLILLNYLSKANFLLKNKAGVNFHIINETKDTKLAIVSLIKIYRDVMSDIPAEVLDLNMIDFNNLPEGQFYNMLLEWEMVLPQTWTPENVVNIFELLESLLEENFKIGAAFSTPKDLVQLVKSVTPINNEIKTIYDPYSRTGEFLSKIGQDQNAKKNQFFASVKNSLQLKIAKTKIFMMGLTNILWITQNDGPPEINLEFDCIISNPPFGMLIPNLKYSGHWANKIRSNRSEIIFLTHILDHLSNNGRATVIVPSGILSASGKTEFLRRSIIEENILEAVISLPTKMFYNTGVSTAILIFNKNRNFSKVILIDATNIGVREKSKHFLSDSDIEAISLIVHNFRNSETINNTLQNIPYKIISREEFDYNNYDFQNTSYTIEERFPKNLLPISDLLRDCCDIEKQLIIVQKNIISLINIEQ